VLKYPLLLRQILDSTNPSQPEYAIVREALNEIIRIADRLNEVKKRRDIVDEVLGNAFGSIRMNSRSSSVGGGAASKRIKKKGDKDKDRSQRSLAGVFGGTSGGASLLVPISETAYRALVSELHKIEVVIQEFPARCLAWCDMLKDSFEAEARLLDQWRAVYVAHHAVPLSGADIGSEFAATDNAGQQQQQPQSHGIDPETDSRINVYLSILLDAVSPTGSCQRLVDAVRGSIVPQTGQMLHLLISPRQVMSKRDGLQPEYARYRYKVKTAANMMAASSPAMNASGTSNASDPSSPGLPPSSSASAQQTPQQSNVPSAAMLAAAAKVNTDTKLVEVAEAFVALHTQLLEELPQLIYGLQLSLDLLVRSFASLQERVFEERQVALMRYWRRWAWEHADVRPLSALPAIPTSSTTPSASPAQGETEAEAANISAGDAPQSKSRLQAQINPELNIVKAFWARQREKADTLSILEGSRRVAASSTGPPAPVPKASPATKRRDSVASKASGAGASSARISSASEAARDASVDSDVTPAPPPRG